MSFTSFSVTEKNKSERTLQNMSFKELFKDNNEINIVFLGGSITEGAGSSDKRYCFANLTGEWFREALGKDRVNYYNKGVGGTPSKYGLLRFGRDVADLNPHIVFIEFAVNDGGHDTRIFTESLVRSLATLPTKPFVAFLYTTNNEYTTDTTYFEQVAEHYKIAQVSLKDALKKLNERELGIITRRFYKGKTQMEIADEIGISQAQVSRIEKGAIDKLRKYMN